MSIATEITRLQNAKASIKASIENKGVTVPSATKLDGYPALIDSISTGSQVTVEPLSVTQNGTYQETGKAYSPVTVNVQGGGGGTGDDVVFIDYDGTVLYKYSKAEIDAMSALPSKPTHAGLTSQGWNWSLADIKSQLTAYPEQTVYVGQMYITDDGDTRLYVHFEEGRTSPYLGLGVNGTVTIDWGDNSATDTLAGTSLTTAKTIQHIYQAGDYVIKLTPTSGSFSIFGVSSTSHLLKASISTTANLSRVYTNAVRKIELGTNVSLGIYAFQSCCSLASITIPDSVTAFGNSVFYNCYSLTSVTISDSLQSIIDNMFYYCYSLTSVTIPDSVTSIGMNSFTSCYSLASVTIPDSVTSIGKNAFSSCYGMAEYHILSTTPPTLGTNAFQNIPTDCTIYVPTESLEAYQTATNWSTYASHMVGE